MASSRDKILAAAQRHIDKGNLNRAIKEYAKLLEEQPDDTRTRLRIGDLQARLGKKSDAIDTYEQVAQEYQRQGFFLKAVAILKQILRLEPSRTDVQIRLADLYLKLNLLSDCLAQYRKVAERYRDKGEHHHYVEILRRMADLDPEDVRAQITLAEHYSSEGDLELASEHFALAADGLRQQERWEEYTKVAERYLFHRHDDVPRTLQLVRVYLQQKEHKRALAKLQLIFKVVPKDTEALDLLVQTFLGLRKADKAVRVLKELAEVYAEEGLEELAFETYQRILVVDPDDPEARIQLGLSIPSSANFAGAVDEDDPLATSVLPFEGSQPIALSEIKDNGADQWRRLKAASGLFTTPNGLTTCNSDIEEGDLEEVARLLVEIDGFEKLGLVERARAALKRVFEIDPLNISAMERAVRLDLARSNVEGAVQRLLRMTRLCWRPDPVRAAGYLHEALHYAPQHPASNQLRTELGLDGIDLETFMLEPGSEDLEILDVDEMADMSDSDLGGVVETIEQPAQDYASNEPPLAADWSGGDEIEILSDNFPAAPGTFVAPDDMFTDEVEEEEAEDELFLDADEPEDDRSERGAVPAPAATPTNPNVYRGSGFHRRVPSMRTQVGEDAPPLPPLPEDLPDELSDDLEELEFLMSAGLRDEAQNLLFDLTTSYPEHTILIMERMALLEAMPRS